MRRLSFGWLTRVVFRPAFWVLVALLVLITILHYAEVVKYPAFVVGLLSAIGITRHALDRILFLFPIILAGYAFGWRGAVTVSFITLAIMLPRAILVSPVPKDALLETGAVFIVGIVLGFGFALLRREREHRLRLAALDQISSMVLSLWN